MQMAVLFLFYKEFDLCRANLRRLRRLNPGVAIFAYHTGDPGNAPAAGAAVDGLVDDFYAFPLERDAGWRWEHFDQLLVTWYAQRGQQLDWDSLFLVQWDMLVAAPIRSLYPNLRADQLLLPGLACMSDIEHWYHFADPRNSDLAGFKRWLADRFDYRGEVYAYPIIVAALPRIFFAATQQSGYPETGYIEYTLPTMAHVYGLEIVNDPRYEIWWEPKGEGGGQIEHLPAGCAISVFAQEIPRSRLYGELARSQGARMFHPVYRPIPPFVENRALAWVLSKFFGAYENSFVYRIPWGKWRRRFLSALRVRTHVMNSKP
jgi:hypothetical protein